MKAELNLTNLVGYFIAVVQKRGGLGWKSVILLYRKAKSGKDRSVVASRKELRIKIITAIAFRRKDSNGINVMHDIRKAFEKEQAPVAYTLLGTFVFQTLENGMG